MDARVRRGRIGEDCEGEERDTAGDESRLARQERKPSHEIRRKDRARERGGMKKKGNERW